MLKTLLYVRKYHILNHTRNPKGFRAKLAPSHTQSAWRSRRERVRDVRLVAFCNYFSQKKKKIMLETYFMYKAIHTHTNIHINQLLFTI